MQMGDIRIHQKGARVDLVLDQPQRKNAMSRAMWQSLQAALREIGKDAGLRVVVVRGSGDAFCAGADISEFKHNYASAEAADAANAHIGRALDAMDELPLASIAAIRGVCMGGGCALALACDLAIADSSARFGINPTALGLAYSPRECQRLVARVGLARAKAILIGARELDASTALHWGLISQVTQPEGLAAAVDAQAEDIASRSPQGLATLKKILLSLDRAPIDESEELQQLFQACFRSQDLQEGSAAFIGKRKPAFGERVIP